MVNLILPTMQHYSRLQKLVTVAVISSDAVDYAALLRPR